MAESWKVNSVSSLAGFLARAQILAKDNEQVRFFWKIGKDRSLDQNDMTFELYTRIGIALYGNDTEMARRECKLTIGVPILRRDDESFKHSYDKVIRPHDYETKMELMGWFPVSSLMGIKQCSEYINRIIDTYTLKGVDFSMLAGAA